MLPSQQRRYDVAHMALVRKASKREQSSQGESPCLQPQAAGGGPSKMQLEASSGSLTFPALSSLSRQGSQVPLLPLDQLIPEREVQRFH